MGCLHAVYATQRCRAAARHRCYAAGLQVVLRWCAQVHSMVTKLAQFTDIRAALIVGGLSLSVQAATLRTSPEILVATPASPLPASSLPLDVPHHLCGLKKLQDTHKRHRHVRRVPGVWLLHWFYLPVRLCCLPWLNAGAIASDSAKQMEPQFCQWGPIFCTRSHNHSATIFMMFKKPLAISSAPF